MGFAPRIGKTIWLVSIFQTHQHQIGLNSIGIVKDSVAPKAPNSSFGLKLLAIRKTALALFRALFLPPFLASLPYAAFPHSPGQLKPNPQTPVWPRALAAAFFAPIPATEKAPQFNTTPQKMAN